MADKKDLPKAGTEKAILLRPQTYNALRDAASRPDIQPDPREFDIQERHGKKYFRLRPGRAAEGGGGAAGSTALFPAVVAVPDSPGDYLVTVTPGFLAYQNAGASESEDGVTGVLKPKMGGKELDDPELVPLALPGLVSFTYLRVRTDADGVPKFSEEEPPVTIETFEEAQKSTHHVRDSPTSGEEEGDYYFLLLETESDGADPPAPRVKKRVAGNRYLPNQLVKNKNIGGERELYSGYLVGPDDEHQWRTLKQLVEGEDQEVNVIQDLEEGEDEEDFIPFMGFGVKQTGQYPPRPATFEKGPDKAVNLLKFFGLDGDADLSAGGVINFAGGLAVSFSANPPDDPGAAKNLNLSLYAIDYDEGGSIFGSEYLMFTLYWRAGKYVGLIDPGDAPAQLDEISIRMVGV